MKLYQANKKYAKFKQKSKLEFKYMFILEKKLYNLN